jgi:two-component system response regulator AtoC
LGVDVLLQLPVATALDGDLDLATTASDFVAGRSEAIQAVNTLVREIAGTDIPILIVGESGTGKEVYARLIHRLSPFGNKPVTRLSCRAMDVAKFVDEIRACVKGDPQSDARHEQTVFLDGVDELDLAGQKALLHALPDGQENGNGRFRLISSASKSLEREIEAGRFRKELYFRTSGACVRLPALRERAEDLSLLLEHFLTRDSRAIGRERPVLSEEELAGVASYDWPGNVRELEYFARRISLLRNVRETIAELHRTPKFAAALHGEANAVSLKVVARAASRQAEKELIREALERTHWNRKRAAQQLRISYKSLLYKIKQTGLEGL